MALIDDPKTLPALLMRGQKMLGLDLGTKTIGLALSDTNWQIATALETIQRRKFSLDAAYLDALIIREKIGALVVGLPYNMDGSEGPRAQATRAFIHNYFARPQTEEQPPTHNIPAILWDERLSTQAVERTLIEADMSRAKRAKLIDKLAASYILQGYLDFLGNL
ncbi:MAG: Holliday junction resolvase RuvX [Alphaproteobacteria bacterium]|nr:Holliday junction resolvase RuvX [Alphaproteobacteria bacterium]